MPVTKGLLEVQGYIRPNINSGTPYSDYPDSRVWPGWS